MKKLSKIRLTQLGMDELQTRQMNTIRGGASYYCSCMFACTCHVSWISESNAIFDGYDNFTITDSEAHWEAFNTCNIY